MVKGWNKVWFCVIGGEGFKLWYFGYDGIVECRY